MPNPSLTADNLAVPRDHGSITFDLNTQIAPDFEIDDFAALFIQKILGHFHRDNSFDPVRFFLQGFQAEFAQKADAQGFCRRHQAFAVTLVAGLVAAEFN